MQIKPLACFPNRRSAHQAIIALAFAGTFVVAEASGAIAATASVTYTYDTQGRVATALYYVGGTLTRTITYHYDAAGNRTSAIAS